VLRATGGGREREGEVGRGRDREGGKREGEKRAYVTE